VTGDFHLGLNKQKEHNSSEKLNHKKSIKTDVLKNIAFAEKKITNKNGKSKL